MTQHTDERDAYEHIVRQMPEFTEGVLYRKSNRYELNFIEFGWQIFQTTRLMSAQGEFHS